MGSMESIIYILNTLDPKTKKHVVGGILLGVSMFFGVMAITIFSSELNKTEIEEESDEY